MLRIVAGVCVHHILCMPTYNLVLDWGLVWVVVCLSEPPCDAGAVSSAERAWENAWVVVIKEL